MYRKQAIKKLDASANLKGLLKIEYMRKNELIISNLQNVYSLLSTN